ncbi:hypothetical protein PR003_g20573 [Phytophthora rubi]|uniref:Pectate lyase n=1 Tax=Phytophthora rubi TaxID=129364 RepID=A0A6A4DLJ3_9STRA|nr:hypothetical protein PR001_g19831 [Phytophthora rubi]KAE9309167.1 hypothetical protein PR003_g20573 [Phytophthora rubi]
MHFQIVTFALVIPCNMCRPGLGPRAPHTVHKPQVASYIGGNVQIIHRMVRTIHDDQCKMTGQTIQLGTPTTNGCCPLRD